MANFKDIELLYSKELIEFHMNLALVFNENVDGGLGTIPVKTVFNITQSVSSLVDKVHKEAYKNGYNKCIEDTKTYKDNKMKDIKRPI